MIKFFSMAVILCWPPLPRMNTVRNLQRIWDAPMPIQAAQCAVALRTWKALLLYLTLIVITGLSRVRLVPATTHKKYIPALCIRPYLALQTRVCLALWIRACLALWIRACLALWIRACLALWIRACPAM